VASTWSFGQAANAQAWRVLEAGGQPLDACEAGVQVSEADPSITSVGYGGLPNAEGVVELDASVMRGDTLECGAVAALRGFLHPVSAARAVMERTRHVLLVGEGAARFARAQGLLEQDLLTPESRQAWEAWKVRQAAGAAEPWERERLAVAGRDHDHDTIGMIVADRGRLATAVTTSGLAWKLPGRVGDSPIIGAGSYCDDEAGAAVSTGVGEEVIRVGGCVSIVEGLRRGLTPRRAGLAVLQRVRRAMARAGRSGDVAFIVASREGEVWGGCLVPGFQYALTGDDGARLVTGEVVS
jgi:N4-(beta-N-acetylglucosaminyl)-L-asparaginase